MARLRTSRKTNRITVTHEQSVYDGLCKIVQQEDVSVAWIVRRAVKELIGDMQRANDKFAKHARSKAGWQR